ncbi:MAG: permease prefix domain 1-containing protein [Limisphaerales bacterium]
MENQTRFDLNAAVENWRQELAAHPNLALDDRRELETHLRDAITEFRQRGLNDEEAFWLARQRIGRPQQLAEEFTNGDPTKVWRERAFWMMFVLFLSVILINVISVLAYDLQVVRTQSDGASFQMAQTIARELVFLLPVLIPLVLAILVRSGKMVHLISKLRFLIENRLRLAIGIFGIIAIAAAFVTVAAITHNEKIHSLGLGLPRLHARLHLMVSIWQILYSAFFYPVTLALVLFLLMPSKNQRKRKHA